MQNAEMQRSQTTRCDSGVAACPCARVAAALDADDASHPRLAILGGSGRRSAASAAACSAVGGPATSRTGCGACGRRGASSCATWRTGPWGGTGGPTAPIPGPADGEPQRGRVALEEGGGGRLKIVRGVLLFGGPRRVAPACWDSRAGPHGPGPPLRPPQSSSSTRPRTPSCPRGVRRI